MKRKILYLIILAIVLACVAVIYYAFDPSSSALFPKCPFLMLTGYKCPGCGSQRAIHALLSGDLAAAWHYNALLLVSIPFIILLLAGMALRRRYPRFDAAINSVGVVWTVFVVIMAWWLLRNIFGW